MTNEKRFILQTDAAFMDEVVRECAMLTIQHEADQLKITALEERIAEQAARIDEMGSGTVHASDADELRQTRQRLARAKNVIEWLMAGGEPCRVCEKVCRMGAGCEPVWNEEADL